MAKYLKIYVPNNTNIKMMGDKIRTQFMEDYFHPKTKIYFGEDDKDYEMIP